MSDAKQVAPAFNGSSVGGAGGKRRKHTMAGLKALGAPKAMDKNKHVYCIYMYTYMYTGQMVCSLISTLFCFTGLT